MFSNCEKIISELIFNISSSLNSFGLVPEVIFPDSQELRANASPRLLCQTRGIIFLLKSYEYFNDEKLLKLAIRLYEAVKNKSEYSSYFDKEHNITELSKLSAYELSFLLYSQSILYLHSDAMPKKELNNDIRNSLKLIEDITLSGLLFRPINLKVGIEQNSAMHIFESLTQCAKTKIINESYALKYYKTIMHKFLNPKNNIIAEYANEDGSFECYQLGHNFEWVSLLLNLEKSSGAHEIAQSLYRASLSLVKRNEHGIIINEYDDSFLPINQKQRIWPSLEYIRASILVGEFERSLSYYNVMERRFFTRSSHYREYEDDVKLQCKTTTGYHIIEMASVLRKARPKL
ncbi:hypothetical protein CWI66_16590 [Halomonas sp. 141]|uniref:AGE family epimerase/isomerase n=1 Tax=Halomonadaceae TaxID=28256 RepID=UPI000305C47C|nr:MULTISPECIES: AGE family epimerase/isomerase [Halomonas]PJX12643.1 hypothetical protein CWI66_16590 [Halomonas sp. 141]